MKRLIIIMISLLFLLSCEKKECKQCDIFKITFYFLNDFREPYAANIKIILCDEALKQLDGKTVIEDYKDSSIIKIINCK